MINCIYVHTIQEVSPEFTFQTLLYYYFLNYLFIYFIFVCTGSSLLHTDFLYLQQVGSSLHCGVPAFHCSGFSCGAWAVGHTGLSSCGTWAQLWPIGLVALWHVEPSQTRIEPMSSALAGRQILIHCTTREIPNLYFKTPDFHLVSPFHSG